MRHSHYTPSLCNLLFLQPPHFVTFFLYNLTMQPHPYTTYSIYISFCSFLFLQPHYATSLCNHRTVKSHLYAITSLRNLIMRHPYYTTSLCNLLFKQLLILQPSLYATSSLYNLHIVKSRLYAATSLCKLIFMQLPYFATLFIQPHYANSSSYNLIMQLPLYTTSLCNLLIIHAVFNSRPLGPNTVLSTLV